MEKLHSFIVLYNGKFTRVYNESDVDEVIRRKNYKLCLMMAERCLNKTRYYYESRRIDSARRMWKWRQRWLELAKKFNPNNSTAQ